MARKRPITSFGWAIKRRLAELEMDQRKFCKKEGIPENRLGEIMTGSRLAAKHRKQIEKALDIQDVFDNKTEMEVSNETTYYDERERHEAICN